MEIKKIIITSIIALSLFSFTGLAQAQLNGVVTDFDDSDAVVIDGGFGEGYANGSPINTDDGFDGEHVSFFDTGDSDDELLEIDALTEEYAAAGCSLSSGNSSAAFPGFLLLGLTALLPLALRRRA